MDIYMSISGNPKKHPKPKPPQPDTPGSPCARAHLSSRMRAAISGGGGHMLRLECSIPAPAASSYDACHRSRTSSSSSLHSTCVYAQAYVYVPSIGL